MKLLICVCNTKRVERCTVNGIVILSVTISYVKREWVSVVTFPLSIHNKEKQQYSLCHGNNKVQYLHKLQVAWPITSDST